VRRPSNADTEPNAPARRLSGGLAGLDFITNKARPIHSGQRPPAIPAARMAGRKGARSPLMRYRTGLRSNPSSFAFCRTSSSSRQRKLAVSERTRPRLDDGVVVLPLSRRTPPLRLAVRSVRPARVRSLISASDQGSPEFASIGLLSSLTDPAPGNQQSINHPYLHLRLSDPCPM
jgi:hypothetical protein